MQKADKRRRIDPREHLSLSVAWQVSGAGPQSGLPQAQENRVEHSESANRVNGFRNGKCVSGEGLNVKRITKKTQTSRRTSVKGDPARINLKASLVFLTLAGCESADVTGVPPPVGDLTLQSAPASAQYTENLWKGFAEALGLSYASPAEGNKSSEQLEAELSSFPEILSDSRYQELNTLLTESFVERPSVARVQEGSAGPGSAASKQSSPVYRTRCASIERFTRLTDIKATYRGPDDQQTELAGVGVYKVEYVLQGETLSSAEDSDGDSVGDQVVRTALITMPEPKSGEAESAVPLIIYGHGGDNGASYSEIAEVFGQDQQRFVIAAPSFPGEPICERGFNRIIGACSGATLASPSGVSQPFDTDADEMLGIQDCLTRAVFRSEEDPDLKQRGLDAPLSLPRSSGDSATRAVPPSDLAGFSEETHLFSSENDESRMNAQLARLLLRYGELPGATTADKHISRHPVTHISGSSRGGLTSLVALAKAGAALRDPERWQGDVALSRFQCAALLFPPTTFTMGTFRIALELFVKGQAENSRFFALPAASQLSAFFSEYREGNISKEEMLKKFVVIDGLLNIHLSVNALRNWSLSGATEAQNSASGDLLMIHGQQDQVVNSEQTFYYGSLVSLATQRVQTDGWAPGVRAAILSFAPPPDRPFPTGSLFGDAIYQHGDSVFRASTQVADDGGSTPEGSDGWGLIETARHPEHLNEAFMKRSGHQPAERFSTWLSQECGKR